MTKRLFRVDEQGRRDLEEATRRLNERTREIEEESAARTGKEPTGPVVRVFARPATDEEIAAAEAEAARKEGTPPL